MKTLHARRSFKPRFHPRERTIGQLKQTNALGDSFTKAFPIRNLRSCCHRCFERPAEQCPQRGGIYMSRLFEWSPLCSEHFISWLPFKLNSSECSHEQFPWDCRRVSNSLRYLKRSFNSQLISDPTNAERSCSYAKFNLSTSLYWGKHDLM